MKQKGKESSRKGVSITSLSEYLGYPPNSQNKIHSLFSKDSTASFQLYEDTARYKCWSTNRAGDAIDLFLAVDEKRGGKHTRKTAEQEIKKLMAKGLVKSAILDGIKIGNKNNFTIWNDEKITFNNMFKYYHEHLLESIEEAESHAYEYLLIQRSLIQMKIYNDLQNYCLSFAIPNVVKKYLLGEERKFSKKTISKAGIFYIHDVTATISYLRKEYSKEDLEKSGLFSNNTFVFKSHRLIFPYIESSQIVYLTGRILYKKKDDASTSPTNISKYKGLSNVSSNLSRKRFYNQQILKKLKIGDKLFICEGEADTLIAIQWSLNAIGVPGIHNFPYHLIDKIKDYDLHFCFDSDPIAQEAVRKIMNMINKDVKNVELTNCKDLTIAYDKKYNSIEDCKNIKIRMIHKKSSSLIKASELVNHINEDEGESIIPGLLYEGYTIVAGFSKVGKSMMSLELALRIARGQKSLGYFIPDDKYSVLFMGYEDPATRIYKRMTKMVKKIYPFKIPDNLFFMDRKELPLMTSTGIQVLEEKLHEHPNIKVIFIDTYAAATDDGDDANPYNYKRDASLGRKIQKFALDNHIAVIVVHHLKKKVEKYRINAITGTTGILAAADSIIMLEHIKKDRFSLYVKARDIAENEYLVQATNENHTWKIAGDSRFINLPDNTIKVYSVFKNDYELQLKSKRIAEVLKMEQSEVCRHLTELVTINIIKETDKKNSLYQLCPKRD